MKLEKGKCTFCGGDVFLDPSVKSSLCKNCGSVIKTDDVLNPQEGIQTRDISTLSFMEKLKLYYNDMNSVKGWSIAVGVVIVLFVIIHYV